MKFYENFIFLSFLLLPISLITGPLIVDITASTGALFIILHSLFISKNFTIFKNKYFILILIYLAYLIISSLLSEYKWHSLETSIIYFRFIFFLIALIFIIEKYLNFLNYFCIICLLVLFVVTTDALFQYFYGFNILGYEFRSQNLQDRLSGLFGDEKILGNFIIKIYPLFFATLIFNSFIKNNNIKFVIFTIITFLSLFVIILSGERTSIFYFCLFIIYSSLFVRWERKKRFIVLLLVSISILIMSIKNEHFQTRIEATLHSNHGIFGEEGLRFFSPTHHIYYTTAFKMFKDNIISGIGPKNYRNYCKKPEYNISLLQKYKISEIITQKEIDDGSVYLKYPNEKFDDNTSCTTHPHHFHLQILAETGIFGYILFLIFFFILLKEFIFNIIKYRDDVYFIVIFPVLQTMSIITPSANVFNNYFSIVLYLLIGFFIISYRRIHLKNK